MNQVVKKQILITYYEYEPFSKQIYEEENEISNLCKEKKLLHHAGHVIVSFPEVKNGN